MVPTGHGDLPLFGFCLDESDKGGLIGRRGGRWRTSGFGGRFTWLWRETFRWTSRPTRVKKRSMGRCAFDVRPV